jgi:hypothetical protein
MCIYIRRAASPLLEERGERRKEREVSRRLETSLSSLLASTRRLLLY